MLIEVKNDIEEINRVRHIVQDFCKSRMVSDKKFHDIIIIFDEIITNIIKYAYQDDQNHTFVVHMDKDNDRVIISFIDDGIAFDPLEKVDPDTQSLSIEERPIGGLGIFLVKQLADVVKYSRIGKQNRLDVTVAL
ncbi:MAG: ATP-binding protein [Holosporaceae bacterium]|jgi:anti-sigma regulatory factor (Ser/Thr protein kinase)|nr:ATP-binding protein [Holosporaceae bacterium]